MRNTSSGSWPKECINCKSKDKPKNSMYCNECFLEAIGMRLGKK